MTKELKRTSNPIADLIELMSRLRDPQTGCPWDIEQSFETIAPYTIEEAYEVSDAIERGDTQDLKEELGDLFLQVVFHAQIASDSNLFDIHDVAKAIVEKMVRRHPHVFSDVSIEDAEAQTRAWETMKAAERAAKKEATTPPSAIDGVAKALPALMRAEKILKRAARTGFDWPDTRSVLAKLEEELGELSEAATQGDHHAVEEEMGDVLFVVANLARKHGIDPEIALRQANDKFERRFRGMESKAVTAGKEFSSLELSEMEALWSVVKSAG